VVGSRAQLADNIVSSPHFDAPAVIRGTADAVHSTFAREQGSPGGITLPLRAHLLLQVLLI